MVIEVYRAIGENIIRRRGSMSQKDLSELSKVSRATIAAAEGGQGCSLESLIQIAEALGCKPQDLFITDADRKEVSYQHILLIDLLKNTLIPK